MTPARRLGSLCFLGMVLAVALQPGSASAAPADWGVEGWSRAVSTDGAVAVSGTITYRPLGSPGGRITQVTVTLTRVPALAGCPPVSLRQAAYPDDDTPLPAEQVEPEPPRFPFEFAFSRTLQPVCNGVYSAAVVGTLDAASGPGGEEDSASDDETSNPIPQVDGGEPVLHEVNAAPPDVQSIGSQFDARSRVVGLAFAPPAGYGTANGCNGSAATDHPDFTGYSVFRAVGDAAFPTTPIATVPPGSQCFFDQLPADAPLGQYRYRVLASRSGTAGPVLSPGAEVATTTVAVGAAPPVPTATITATPPRAAPAVAGGSAPNTITLPPVTAPPSDGPVFDEVLGDEEEPGEAAADLPDDAGAFLDFVPSPGPGILVPFAIAECLAVWAFHLRYLARRADDGF